MKLFKFFSDDENDEITIEPYEGTSWMWGRREDLNQFQYDIVEENHYGIHSFLNQFPPTFVAYVLTIVGPNGRLHDIDSEYEDGWGFDITSGYINIKWVRFRQQPFSLTYN
jgi:hypothetical protein